MSPLVAAYLLHNFIGQNRIGIVEVDFFPTRADHTAWRVRTVRLSSNTDTKELDTLPIKRIGVELRLQIFQVECEFQDFHFSRRLALGRSKSCHGKCGHACGRSADGLQKAASIGRCGDYFVDQIFRHNSPLGRLISCEWMTALDRAI